MVIPFAEIETLFLDVGNTLISIDFEWVARELDERGIAVRPTALRRAEAAARPQVSRRLYEGPPVGAVDAFGLYLTSVLELLEPSPSLAPTRIEALVEELAPVLQQPGQADRLWCSVMPGVRASLEDLEGMDLKLVVVSNADGSVERSLRRLGLRGHFDAVIDSAVVGYEKPDRRIFECAVSESGADRSRTLHVGDLYHADVEGARSAGLHALLLDPFGDWPEPNCERLPDLVALVDRLRSAQGLGS